MIFYSFYRILLEKYIKRVFGVNIGEIPTNIVRGQPRGAKCLKFPTFANLLSSYEVES